eukprot:GFYU01004825.1.p1 GENE.GFYU01004825.1~~GFYU01004825.1.p1  ORF type:complete len:196 (-),score=21.68 GFYU01004825.1:393-980(-)
MNLPPLEQLLQQDARGPHENSNWVIRDHLMQGAYPGSVKFKKHIETLDKIVKSGIDTFVCLVEDHELARLNSYPFVVRHLLEEANDSRQMEFLRYPIVDMNVTTDENVVQIVNSVIAKLEAGKKVYVHCWGGHGRAGTVISIVLGKLYGIDGDKAMEICGKFHQTREVTNGFVSPQADSQFEQVRRVVQQLNTAS